jgi:hypothetical protein
MIRRQIRSTERRSAMNESERSRFYTAAVAQTIQTIRADDRAQQAAWTVVSRGWVAFGDELIELVARPKKARDGGRLWGAIVREQEPAA